MTNDKASKKPKSVKSPEKSTKPNKRGAPTKFNQEIADLICERVATHDMGLKRLCAMYPDMPPEQTINVWRLKHEEFHAQYVRAKLRQADLLAESLDDIALEKGTYFDADGNERTDPGFNAEKRLRIDTRKWLVSKLIPKVYGDRTISETTVTIVKHEDALKELE